LLAFLITWFFASFPRDEIILIPIYMHFFRAALSVRCSLSLFSILLPFLWRECSRQSNHEWRKHVNVRSLSTAGPRFRLMSACVDKHSVGGVYFLRMRSPSSIVRYDTGIFSDVCHGKSLVHTGVWRIMKILKTNKSGYNRVLFISGTRLFLINSRFLTPISQNHIIR